MRLLSSQIRSFYSISVFRNIPLLSLLLIMLSYFSSLYAKDTGKITNSPYSQDFMKLVGDYKGTINKERDHLRSKDRKLLRTLGKEYKKRISRKNLTNKAASSASIPHKLHFIWVGPKPFPQESIQYVQSWKKHHADWQIYFWTDSEDRPVPVEGMQLRLVSEYDFSPLTDFIAKTNNWGEKSDLMRFVILHNEGGIYVDHDAECLRPFHVFADNFDFFACLERPHYHVSIDTCVVPANGLFGSCAQHIILKKTMKRVQDIWYKIEAKHPSQDSTSNFKRVIQRSFDSFAISTIFWRNKENNKDLILPTAFFYPDKTFNDKTIAKLKKKKIIFSSHKFASAWRQ